MGWRGVADVLAHGALYGTFRNKAVTATLWYSRRSGGRMKPRGLQLRGFLMVLNRDIKRLESEKFPAEQTLRSFVPEGLLFTE